MSDIETVSSSGPADVPIYTQGNWFWHGEERFLIKGISYVPRLPGSSSESESRIDPLDDTRLNDLRRDIDVIRGLGLNTIQVSALDPSRSHAQAMKLLAEAGIYVIVVICGNLDAPDVTSANRKNFDTEFDTSPYYTAEVLGPALKIADELADYPNLLGFMVRSNAIKQPVVSKIAEVYRSIIRDIKVFLRARGGRCPPTGVGVSHLQTLLLNSLQYFTAGESDERTDFFAFECYSWAYKSNFRVSGWENTVAAFDPYPVPMFLSAYGSYVGKSRIWQEVVCLYSPYMTGAFSGGCLYTYFEYYNNYGIVQLTEKGLTKKPEFARLKQQFDAVNCWDTRELYVDDVKDYEGWNGEFPDTVSNRWGWFATADIPTVPGGLNRLIQGLTDEGMIEGTGKMTTAEKP